MDGRKRRASSNSDELALVKAAAWAWYHRGSGDEGKPAREFDFTRARREPRPSRFKLEASIKAAKDIEAAAERITEPSMSPESTSPVHIGNSLLDLYEIERITRQLDRLIVSGGGGGGGFSRSGSGAGGGRSHRKDAVSSPESDGNGRRGVAKVNGFWLRHGMGMCRSSGDVVEARRVLVGKPRRRRFGQ